MTALPFQTGETSIILSFLPVSSVFKRLPMYSDFLYFFTCTFFESKNSKSKLNGRECLATFDGQMADTVNLFLVSISVGLIYFICFTESLGAVIQSQECGTGQNLLPRNSCVSRLVIPQLYNRLNEAHGNRLEPVPISSAKLDYSFDVTKRGAYDLFSKTHQDRYKDIPGENNSYIADWLAYEHEKILNHENVFDKYNESEEGCLKA
ncbi:hypothetical protein CAEBREN_15718 [Caenorhabditis brenneri]|uniref:Uncharacterized protein n=1 Tax=Caenorhabditis brenneri TaxID=135651 RepID=G0P104_CAEBE|nr:hypothetical protein CAEBREN_15718 [Caenorhabditis brenneri]